jgi:hypothetical protein
MQIKYVKKRNPAGKYVNQREIKPIKKTTIINELTKNQIKITKQAKMIIIAAIAKAP